MSINVMDFYSGRTNVLSEQLRRNWLQKLDSLNTVDDSLTNLTWLHDMHPVAIDIDPTHKATFSRNITWPNCLQVSSAEPHQPFAGSLLDPQVRYDYRTKWTGKPPFSYATLICLAMKELGKPKVTLSDIYGWIMGNFAYYRHTDSSWQNSVRHNLSLNKCFEKVPRDKNERGKGGFWRVNPKHTDWLEANLAKCRRAAPPPGPPPPIPRSWLHQQLHQQASHEIPGRSSYNTLMPLTMNGSPNNVLFHSMANVNNFDQFKESCTTLSPMVTSLGSCSLSSSSPSLGSVPSPTGNIQQNSGNLRLAEPETESGFEISSRLFPPLKQTHLGTHRRKSPLHLYSSYNEDDLPGITRAESLKGLKYNEVFNVSSNVTSERNLKSNVRDRHGFDERLPEIDDRSSEPIRNLERSWDEKAHQSSVIRSKSNKSQKKWTVASTCDTTCTPVVSECQDAARNKVKVSTRKRDKSSVQTLPTRVLPPRRRYSRWSRQRQTVNICASQSVIGRSRITARNTACSKRLTHIRTKQNSTLDDEPQKQCIDELLTEVGDCETEINWPPSNPQSAQKRPAEFPCIVNITGPNQSVAPQSPTLVTPHYVPAGLSPHNKGCTNLDSQSSSTSSSSVCSFGSGNSRYCSDGHMYQTLPPIKHSTPRRVETQARKERLTDSLHFGRLYPASYEAECFLACSTDQMKMPKWAAVFLPESEHCQFGPMSEKPSENGGPERYNHRSGDKNDRSSVCSDVQLSTEKLSDQPTFLNTSISCSNCDQDAFHSFSSDPYSGSFNSLTRSPSNEELSTGPMLEGLELDQVELDFEVLNGLVESTGPIPLDLEFGLTAGSQSPYHNAVTAESNPKPPDGDQYSIFTTPSNPSQTWTSTYVTSSLETISDNWYNENHRYLDPNNALNTEFDDVDAMFDKSVEMRRQYESSLDHLNTPPH